MTETTGSADISFLEVTLALGARTFLFDFRIEGGSVTVVAGSSGSGKSTLLNLLAGFERPDSGRILIGGEDVSTHPPARRPVSIVFQDNNLFAHLDLFTNIGLGIHPSLKLDTEDRRAVGAALERVGLGGYERRLPPTLSGGERQRAAFARALVRKKPVLLLDEPFAALDPGLRGEMAALLLDLHRETNNTLVVVSHDPDEVARIADHVLFVDDGRILLSAPAGEFQRSNELPAIRRFFGR